MLKLASLLTVVLCLTFVASAATTTVYVDMTGNDGPTTGETIWNNFEVAASGLTAAAELVDTKGKATGISLAETKPFNPVANGAGSVGTEDAAEFAPCGKNTPFGNTKVGDNQGKMPQLTLTGLKAGATYTVTYYASGSGSGAPRNTILTLIGADKGAATATATLDGYGNKTKVASASAKADDNGTIVMDLSTDEGNQYFYFNAFKLTYDADGATTTAPATTQPAAAAPAAEAPAKAAPAGEK